MADDHNEIANGIINVITEFKRKKKNNKDDGIELKEFKINDDKKSSH